MNLFKIKLESDIKGLPDKIEYLRCKNIKMLKNMYEQCFNIKDSMYYGYHHYTIKKITLKEIPEVRQLVIE